MNHEELSNHDERVEVFRENAQIIIDIVANLPEGMDPVSAMPDDALEYNLSRLFIEKVGRSDDPINTFKEIMVTFYGTFLEDSDGGPYAKADRLTTYWTETMAKINTARKMYLQLEELQGLDEFAPDHEGDTNAN